MKKITFYRLSNREGILFEKLSSQGVEITQLFFWGNGTQCLRDIQKTAAWESTYYQGVAGSGISDITLAKYNPADIFNKLLCYLSDFSPCQTLSPIALFLKLFCAIHRVSNKVACRCVFTLFLSFPYFFHSKFIWDFYTQLL